MSVLSQSNPQPGQTKNYRFNNLEQINLNAAGIDIGADSHWIQQLDTYGLLSGSFRPEDQVCRMRSYIRQRDNLIKSSSTHIQRMQKALTEMNVQLHRVISDITGTRGREKIRAK